MLSIGNKKYRNLQEQVGFNTEQIEKIFQVLDGLSVQDNVVVISDLSTPLTTEELEIVSREVAFIIYSDQLYIKKSEDASNAYFDVIVTISSAGGVISLASKEITVTLSNGALGYVSSTDDTYSKTQLDTSLGQKADTTYVDAQLALKANLAGADFTGDVTANTLKQNQANWKMDVNTFPNITGGTSSPIFCRIQQINQELHIVMVGKVENTTESAITAYSLSYVQVDLPSQIANKIYDVLGNKASDTPSGNVRISYSYAPSSLSYATDMSKFKDDAVMVIINLPTTNRIGINFQSKVQFNLPAGETFYFEGRVSLDLI